MSEGEFKKRAVHDVVIDFGDIKQSITEDKGLLIDIPDEKYLVRMKDLFEWIDEATKEFPMQKELIQNLTGGPYTQGAFNNNSQKIAEWFKKWFPH